MIDRRPTPQILLRTGYRRPLLKDQNGRVLKLTTHLHLMQSIRIYWAVTPSPRTLSKAQDVPDPRRCVHTAVWHWKVLVSKRSLWVSTGRSVTIGMTQSRCPECVSGRNYGPSHSIVDITAIYVFTGHFMVDRTAAKAVFITFRFSCAPTDVPFEVLWVLPLQFASLVILDGV